MSDPREETNTDQQPWPPAPEGSSDTPFEPPPSNVNAKEIMTGSIMGIIIGVGMTITLAIICLFVSFFFPRPVAGTVLFVVPLIAELIAARWIGSTHKTMGWTFGIVSMAVSVLGGIALILLLIAGTPAPGGE